MYKLMQNGRAYIWKVYKRPSQLSNFIDF